MKRPSLEQGLRLACSRVSDARRTEFLLWGASLAPGNLQPRGRGLLADQISSTAHASLIFYTAIKYLCFTVRKLCRMHQGSVCPVTTKGLEANCKPHTFLFNSAATFIY